MLWLKEKEEKEEKKGLPGAVGEGMGDRKKRERILHSTFLFESESSRDWIVLAHIAKD